MAVARWIAQKYSRRDADELASEAYLKLVELLQECQAKRPDDFDAYVRTGIRNAVKDAINDASTVYIPRRARREKEVPLVQALGVWEKADNEINHLEINDEVETLVADDFELGLIRLRLLGFTDAEIAEKIGCSHQRIQQTRTRIAQRIIKEKKYDRR